MFSLSTVFRHATQASDNLTEKKKKRTGRPRKVTDRDERELFRVLKKLRKSDGSLTSKKIQVEAGLIPLPTLFHFWLDDLTEVF